MTAKDMYNPEKSNRNHTHILREEAGDEIMKQVRKLKVEPEEALSRSTMLGLESDLNYSIYTDRCPQRTPSWPKNTEQSPMSSLYNI